MAVLRDRYEVVGVAGRGGQGRVLKAVDRQHDRLVALKVRPAGVEGDRERLLAEARVLFGLRPHVSLPLVREDFFEGDDYVVVMDWVEGVDLHTECRQRGDPGLGVRRVLGWLVEAAAALDHLHGHVPPVVHGDVKPANVVVRPDGRVVLVDFGSAAGGTFGFAAPEVVAGGPPTPAADVYGLAATALALLTGAEPGQALPSWEGVTPATRLGLERALRLGLATDPGRRPRSAGELVGLLVSRVEEALPAGTVSFVLTDVVGSTPLWDRFPGAMGAAMARHDAVVADVVAEHGGRLVKFRGEGDSTMSVFVRASDAVRAALRLQQAMGVTAWPPDTPLQVRVAVHTGEAEVRDGDYFGAALARAARLRGVTEAGQIVLSEATAQLVADDLPADASLRPLESRSLTGLSRPESPWELDHPDLTPSPTHRPDRDAPPAASAARAPTALPAERSTFVGRTAEVQEVASLLEQHRLVTLVGVGGAGKTRLACRVAADDSHGEVAFIALAGLRDPALVAPSAAAALGVAEVAGRTLVESIADTLAGRRLLLVIDNCEHVLAGTLELGDRLLDRCPEVRILATSREALGLQGERAWRVPALGAGDSGDGVRLFAERAREIDPGFQLGSSLDAVMAICQRLEGVPLAIELAAARIATMSATDIAARLDDQVRLLDGGTTGDGRRTLRSAMRWSVDLLDPAERDAFLALAVFAGGFDVDGARAVAEDTREPVEDVLARLIARSLIEVDRGGDTIRYRLLEPVRQFAEDELERAGKAIAARERLAGWVSERILSGGRDLANAPVELLRWLDDNVDNVRAALAWYLDAGRAVDGLVLPGRLFRHWAITGRLSEGVAWLSRYVEATRGEPDPKRLRPLIGLANLCTFLSRYDEAEAALDEARLLAQATGRAGTEAWAIHHAGHVAEGRGDHERAGALARESGERFAEVGDLQGLAYAWYWAARAELAVGHLAEAERLLDSALEGMTEAGDAEGRRAVQHVQALLELRRGRFDAAAAAAQRSLEGARESGDDLIGAYALSVLGAALALLGQTGAAAEVLRRAMEFLSRVGDEQHLSLAVAGAAKVAVDHGRPTDALALLGASDSYAGNAAASAAVRDVVAAVDGLARAASEPGAADASALRGRGFTIQEMLDLATEVLESPARSTAHQPAAPLPGRLAAVRRGLLVGRAEPLEAARRWVTTAGTDGSRPLLVVTGEAGIGKTRLVAEFAAEARASGTTVRYGRCDAEPRMPYQPFAEALGAGELSVLLAAAAGSGDALVERARRFDAVASALAELAPLLLVLDDLHWADADTVQLLAHLLQREEAGLSALITYRPTDVRPDHPVVALVGRLGRDGLMQRIDLEALDDTALLSLAEGAGADQETARTVAAACGGNPLFAVELLAHLADPARDGQLVPATVEEAVAQRLAGLADAVGTVLRAAAIQGESFTLPIAAAASSLTEDDALDAIEAAVRAGLVREEPGSVDTFRFQHALVRDAISDSMSASRRIRLHEQVAAAIAAVPPAPGNLARLAYHHDIVARALGRGVERAIDLHVEAGADAEAQRAYATAATSYRSALDLLGGTESPKQRVDILLALGRCLDRLARLAEAEGVYRDAVNVARSAQLPVELARAAIGMVGPIRPIEQDYTELHAVLEEAAAGLEGIGQEEELRFAVLVSLAQRLDDGSPRRLALTEDLRSFAARMGTDAARFEVTHLDFWSWDRPPEGRLALADQLVALAAALGGRQQLKKALTGRTLCWIESGAIDQVTRELDRWEVIALEDGDLHFQGAASQLRSSLALHEGDHEAAQRWLAELPAGRMPVGGGATLGFISWMRGQSAELLPVLEATMPSFGGHMGAAYAAFTTLIAVEAGAAPRAHELLESFAAEGWRAVPPVQDPMRPWVLACLAQAVHGLRDRGRACELASLLAPYVNRTAFVSIGGIFGSNHRYAGMLAHTIGDLDAAVNHYRKAIEREAAMRAHPFAAESRWRLALALADQGAATHQAEIESLIGAAVATGESLGLAKLLADARAAAATCAVELS